MCLVTFISLITRVIGITVDQVQQEHLHHPDTRTSFIIVDQFATVFTAGMLIFTNNHNVPFVLPVLRHFNVGKNTF